MAIGGRLVEKSSGVNMLDIILFVLLILGMVLIAIGAFAIHKGLGIIAIGGALIYTVYALTE